MQILLFSRRRFGIVWAFYFLNCILLTLVAFFRRPPPEFIGYIRPRSYPCAFESPWPITSTNRDAILFYATHWKPGLQLSLVSLLSTGTRCRIVLFVPGDFEANGVFMRLVKQFDIEIVRDCGIHKNFLPHGHLLRYECEEKWIAQNLHSLDRVMHSDSYDVFFQGDPFQPVIPHDKILLVKEDFAISQCDWNTQWIKECFGRATWNKIRDNNIICTGVIAGNASEYMRMVQYMRMRPEWTECWDDSQDQPILNNLLWTGAFAVHQFEFVYIGCFNGIFTMHWCQGAQELNFTGDNLLRTPNGDLPFLLHQYNRYQRVINALTEKCKMNSFPQV
jgi:hypothetical protein